MKRSYLIICSIMILFIGKSYASNPVGLKSVGAMGGILFPQSKWNNGFVVELQAELGEVIKYVFLMPQIGYWHADKNREGQDLTYTNIYFGSKFIGFFNAKPRGFYAGLGIQYHIIGEDEFLSGIDVVADEIASRNTTRVGYSIVAGYLLKLKNVSFSFEPRYTLLPGIEDMINISLGASYLLP